MSILEGHLYTPSQTRPLLVKKKGGVDTEEAAGSHCAQSVSLLFSTHPTLPPHAGNVTVSHSRQQKSHISTSRPVFSITLLVVLRPLNYKTSYLLQHRQQSLVHAAKVLPYEDTVFIGWPSGSLLCSWEQLW